jgi:hypothetical protein
VLGNIISPDNSVPLDETLASEIADSLGFVTKLQVVAKAGRATFNPPSQPRAS